MSADGLQMIDMNKMNAEQLEQTIGYRFSDRSMLRQALSHSSYANEHKAEGVGDNERLEFLGDSVLEVVSSEFLYLMFPKMHPRVTWFSTSRWARALRTTPLQLMV